MAHRISLTQMTATDLAQAEAIAAVDPRVPGYYKQVWTLAVSTDALHGGEPVSRQPVANLLEVEIDSEDPDQYPQLKARVEDAKAAQLEGMWHLEP